MSYDPVAMELKWISTGMRRKPGGMLAKVTTGQGTVERNIPFQQ